ncbi:hypothetical protein CLV99_0997 [Sphingobacterium yanglingense]|uniref:Uncharacterized protein n=1 Tax=Sphingobacterium yanglingense TaxID=1437280 RepID=A0A4R6WHE4_9SPHI|nr:hypothetical protein CLV99_0997 [Sphingobacterium yanglingense]
MPNDYRSISQAVNSGVPSLGSIRRSDAELAKEVIIEFISDFVQFLNVGKTMNASQIKQTSVLVLQYFPHLNLADFKVFFEKMKVGHFGKFYDSIDGQLILSKLEEYNQERMNTVESANLEAHKRFKKYGYDPLAKKTKAEEDEEKQRSDLPRMIEVMKSALGEKKQIQEAPKQTISTAKDITQRWLRQFDNLFNGKFGKVVAGMRFLVFGEKRYNLETFMERKFNNLEN